MKFTKFASGSDERAHHHHYCMKTPISAVLLLLLSLTFSMAQNVLPDANGNYSRQSIQNTEVGWIRKLEFKEPPKPISQNGWTYTARQIAQAQQIAQWMQLSFTPRGLLGDLRPSVLIPSPTQALTSKYYDFNEAEKNNLNAVPHTYGAYAKLYFLLKKTEKRQFWSQSDNHFLWSIMANSMELICKQMVHLSSPDEFYFTMPRYHTGMKGEYESDRLEKDAHYRNFTNSPNLRKYDHYLVPPKILDYGTLPYYVVIMTRDGNPLPFEQVTAGELADILQKRLPMMYNIAINNGTRLDNLMEKAQTGLRLLREKIKNREKEFIYIRNVSGTQIDILKLADIEPGKDIYWLGMEKLNQEHRDPKADGFPLLRLKKGVKQALATGEPQWIVFRLMKGTEPENKGEIHLMDHFVSRFNYDYVFQYFFSPQKPASPYQPLEK